MKSTVLVLTLVLAGLSSSVAFADSWRGHSYDRHRGDRYANRYSGYYPGYNSSRYNYRSSWDRHYRYGSPYRGSYVSLSYGNYPSWRYGSRYSGYYHSRHDADSFFGGLVVGGLLGSSLFRDSYRSQPAPVVRTRVVSTPRVVTTTRVTSGVTTSTRPVAGSSRTRLLRDLQGNCFEISYAADGTELRSQLPDANCTF